MIAFLLTLVLVVVTLAASTVSGAIGGTILLMSVTKLDYETAGRWTFNGSFIGAALILLASALLGSLSTACFVLLGLSALILGAWALALATRR